MLGFVIVLSVTMLSYTAMGAPPPTCYFPTYTIRIFENKAKIYDSTAITYYYDGQTVTLSVCTRVPSHGLQAVMNDNAYTFYEWTTQTGYFLDTVSTYSQSNPTTYYPPWGTNGYQGYLLLVLDHGRGNWGGYAASATNAYYAHGRFSLPATLSYQAPFLYNGEDRVATWVGIGGFTGTGNLWQAGTIIHRTQSGAAVVNAFYEFYDALDNVNFRYELAPSIALGKSVDVYVCYAPSGSYQCTNLGWFGTGACSQSSCNYYYIKTTDASNVYGGEFDNMRPDLTTAEWVGEQWSGYPFPGGATFTFSGLTTISYANWGAPYFRGTNGNTKCPSQSLAPTRIASPGTFTLSMIGSC